MAGRPQTKLDEFFSLYPQFPYDPTSGSTDEFYRMCNTFGWNRGDDAREEAFRLFQDALVTEFNDIYGRDDSNLQSWQGLCVALSIAPAPASVKQAKVTFMSIHVNIVDLVDADRTGVELQKFSSVEALRTYTKETGRIFPREHAYAGGMLKYLLREITGTYEGNARVSRKGKSSNRGRGSNKGNKSNRAKGSHTS